MSEIPKGPRKYQIFICHRYRTDDETYGALRILLNRAKNFSWKNLSIQTDKTIEFKTERGLKVSISNKVRQADLMLVFAHGAGKWIDHEVDAEKNTEYQLSLWLTQPVSTNQESMHGLLEFVRWPLRK